MPSPGMVVSPRGEAMGCSSAQGCAWWLCIPPGGLPSTGWPCRGGWLLPRESPPGTTLALTMGSMLGAGSCSVQLAAEGVSVIHVDQLVHALVDEIRLE